MKKFISLSTMAILALTLLTGCKSTPDGDREFIPGKGWVPVK